MPVFRGTFKIFPQQKANVRPSPFFRKSGTCPLLAFVKSIKYSFDESAQKLRQLDRIKFHPSPSPSFSCLHNSLCFKSASRVFRTKKKGHMRTLLM